MTTNRFKQVSFCPEFAKDIKKLRKRFRTLNDDLETFTETALYLFHKLNIDNNGIFHIPGLGFGIPRVFKAKKLACKALKGCGSHSGIRIIYAYYEKDDRIEFIEIYFKGDKENEDRERINCLYKPR